MRKDAEIASALCRRATAHGLIDRGIEHAKDAVVDKPKWSQAHLVLAQAYFARVVMAERTITPLKAQDKEASLANSLVSADAAISAAESEYVNFFHFSMALLKLTTTTLPRDSPRSNDSMS